MCCRCDIRADTGWHLPRHGVKGFCVYGRPAVASAYLNSAALLQFRHSSTSSALQTVTPIKVQSLLTITMNILLCTLL
jgi:hypothetical protein